MTIRTILNNKGHEVVTVGRDATLADAVRLIAQKRIGAVPVVDGGGVIGVVSERDVIHCLNTIGDGALGCTVGDVMSAPAMTIAPDDTVLGALSLMTHRRIRHLPVIEDGALIGLVSIGDLVKFRIDRIEAEAAAMRDYIQQA